jgi:putative hemolysin
LKPLLPHAARVMEVGRSCVHPDHRNGTVMMMLWQELARFMDVHKLDMLFGCASVPTRADGGRMAARIWQHALDKQMLDTDIFCNPRLPLDIEKHGNAMTSDELVMPPLLKGYMRLGAKIASAPAMDEDFGCADFLILLRKADITPRYAKHFFGHTAAMRD